MSEIAYQINKHVMQRRVHPKPINLRTTGCGTVGADGHSRRRTCVSAAVVPGAVGEGEDAGVSSGVGRDVED